MKESKYVSSTSRKEVMDAIEAHGPLTLAGIDKARGLIRSRNRPTFWLQRHGYLGVLPTLPMQFCATGKKLAAPTATVGMSVILEELRKYGPCTAAHIADKLGRSQQHVDVYFRAARRAGLVARLGREKSGRRGLGGYIWRLGKEEVQQPVKKAVKPPKIRAPKPQPEPTVVQVRRDPFTAMFFGSMEAA
jgi:hypothetical protein